MCGRFVITSAPAALRQLFGYVEQPNFPPRYNVAPTQPIPVVWTENGARHFRLMRWGLLPGWVKDPKGFTLLINARSETVLEKPAFKRAIRRRRGLIPADGYYEWKAVDGRKQPFFIHRTDGEPLGFAAVFETWVGPNGEELDTAAIVTAAAGEDLAALHDRVPVSISPRDFERWLDIRGDEVDAILPLMTAPRIGEFAWHPVSSRVNRVANDDEQLLLPISAEEMEAEAPKKVVRKAAAGSADDGQGSLF
jgi:putative SOS response-associated peptidase YedK